MASASNCALDLTYLLEEESAKKSLRWSKSGAPLKHRQFIVFEGLGTSETVGAFNNSIENCLAAILGRVLFRKVDGCFVPYREMLHASGAFLSLIANFENDLVPLLPSAAPIALDSFPGLYVGRKRRNYEQALEEFNSVGFRKSQSHIKMFLKYEKDVRTLKPERIPRVISPAGFVYLLLTGSYVKEVEEKIYHSINEMFGYPVVAKGINYDDLASMVVTNWTEYIDPASIDLDVSKMDQSISKEMLSWVHSIIGRCFVGVERSFILEMLSYSLNPIVSGRADNGWFKYRVEGTLTSGQMFTSLTGVLVICGILYQFCRSYRLRLINCGDDCSLFGELADIRRIPKMLVPLFKAVGMTIELGPVNRILEKLEFCQIHVLRDVHTYRSVRNLSAILSKDTVCLEKIVVPHKLAAWARSVAKGGLACFGGIPIIQNLYSCLLRSHDAYLKTAKLSKRQGKRMRQYEHQRYLDYTTWGAPMTYRSSVPSDTLRISFEQAFGVTPVDQLAMEAYYDNFLFHFEKPCERDVLETAFSLFI